MEVKLLVKENNQKRKLLTKENEAYYEDLLIYIRLQLTLSEQQSEEVLMEMLDHVIEGQKEGKTAKEIFGDDPLTFADEIIEHLPKEEKRNIFSFIGGIIVYLVSWALIIRGVMLLVFSQFTKVNSNINLFVAVVVALTIGVFVFATVGFIFRLVKNSLFKENRSTKKDMVKAGLFGAGGMAIVLIVTMFTPEIGPSVNLNWWISIILGAILWLFHFIVKKKKS